MRWDEQRVENDLRLPGVGDGTVVRTFDAPEAMGINFHEVHARSALNHVPGGRFGFSWTVNPYRGCTHACVYCMAGETPILMADGRTRPLGDVRPGDEIYGTVRRGSYRRYRLTRVLAHWETRKAAYRVVLEDGTALIASADHRFLTNRGWKYVVGAEQGTLQRPYLTSNNKLMGMGSLGRPPEESAEYRVGYLCGMIRGDGHVGSYSYSRPGRNVDDQHRFRLALTDLDALRRAGEYLAEAGVPTDEFRFLKGSESQRSMMAIRNSSRAGVDRVRELIRWPGRPSGNWTRGFLAGIFDAEGGRSGGVVRICNKDSEIIARTAAGFRELGFAATVEKPNAIGACNVRLLGGLREQMRFLQCTDPAIIRKRSIDGIAIKSKAELGVVAVEPMEEEIPMFDITTGTGDFIADGVVSHNCFARRTHAYLDLDAGRDFEREIVVKVNVPELLRKELRRASWKRELVALGTNTDPYQWVESRYRMMPEILAALEQAGTPVSVLTKSPLAMRDVEIYARMSKRLPVSVNLSVPTLDEDAWRATEPHTPSPGARLDAVAELRRRGIDSGVLIAPLMPGINDSPEQVEPIVERAKKAGATFLGGVALHLRGEVKDVFFAWLAAKRPDLIPKYERLYGDRAYMVPAQRQHTTRALRTWSRNRSQPYGRAAERVGDSGGGPEDDNLARRGLPPRQDPPAQSSLF
jgi:DNA repair photolyase